MITATTAPTRAKVNRFTIIKVGPFEGNQMSITVQVDDETGALVGQLTLESTNSQRTGLAYNAGGSVVVGAPVASTAAFLTADFEAFAVAGSFAVKALSLETRLQSTGRIPA